MDRIDKILSNSGYGTRKEVKRLVRYGAVKVDGIPVSSPDAKVDAKKSTITVNDRKLDYREFVYLMLNKPGGYVSATEDNVYPTVIDLLPDEYMHFNVFPAGRLDVDTEGLVILTNDGKFAHNITSPKKHIPKKYFAVPEREVEEQDIKEFAKGMNLGDFVAMPAVLEVCENGCYVTIHEGKFHQVKRMFEKVGNKVKYLKRIQIGGLKLDENLALGDVRELTEGEIELLWI